MSTVIDVHTPDGKRHRHVSSFQTGDVEARDLADGGVEIVAVHATREFRGQDGTVVRAATRSEEVVGTYPAGSTVKYVAR